MKKVFIFSAIVLAACTAKKVADTTTATPATQPADPSAISQGDVDRMSSKFPGISVASLNDGKIQYETHCQSCHGLPKPESEDEAEWNRIVPDMVRKTNRKAGKVAVDSTGQARILQYVVTITTKNPKH